MIFVPAIRGSSDAEYETIEKKPIYSVEGEQIAEASKIPPLVLFTNSNGASYRTKNEGFQNLHDLEIEEILQMMKKASKLFLGDSLSMTFDEYARSVVSIKGLPINTVINSAKMIASVMGNMQDILVMHTSDVRTNEGLIEAYDEKIITKQFFQYAWVPQGRNLGVVTPANHPAVNILWIEALALKYPIVIRPSYQGIFTPYRLVEAFYEAGFPEHSIHFLPGEHDLVDALVEHTDKKILFGGEKLQKRYEHRTDTKVYGPGKSKMIVDSGCDIEEAIELIVESMMVDGGRGCINLSAVVAREKADEIAKRVAQEISQIEHMDLFNPNAQLAAMEGQTAKKIDEHIEQHLGEEAKDITEQYRGERYVEENGRHYLLPTVIHCEDHEHPLFGKEFPFPFITITEVDDVHTASKNSLVVTVLTEEEETARKIMLDPSIKKMYNRLSTFDINPLEPHEGFITDFLFQKDAVSV